MINAHFNKKVETIDMFKERRTKMNSKFRSKGIVPESRLSDPDILDILNEPYSLESLRKEAENMIDYDQLSASEKRYIDKLREITL